MNRTRSKAWIVTRSRTRTSRARRAPTSTVSTVSWCKPTPHHGAIPVPKATGQDDRDLLQRFDRWLPEDVSRWTRQTHAWAASAQRATLAPRAVARRVTAVL